MFLDHTQENEEYIQLFRVLKCSVLSLHTLIVSTSCSVHRLRTWPAYFEKSALFGGLTRFWHCSQLLRKSLMSSLKSGH